MTELKAATRAAARTFRATVREELEPALAQTRAVARRLVDGTASTSDAQQLFDALVAFHSATRVAWFAAVDAGVGAAYSTLGSCGAGSTPPDFLYGGGGALDDLLIALESEYARALTKLRRDVDRVVELSAQSPSLRLTARLDSPIADGELEHAYKAGSYILSLGPFAPVIDVALGVTSFGAAGGTQRVLLVSGTSHDDEVSVGYGGFSTLAVHPVQDRFVSSIPVSASQANGGSEVLIVFTGPPSSIFTDVVGIGIH